MIVEINFAFVINFLANVIYSFGGGFSITSVKAITLALIAM